VGPACQLQGWHLLLPLVARGGTWRLCAARRHKAERAPTGRLASVRTSSSSGALRAAAIAAPTFIAIPSSGRRHPLCAAAIARTVCRGRLPPRRSFASERRVVDATRAVDRPPRPLLERSSATAGPRRLGSEPLERRPSRHCRLHRRNRPELPSRCRPERRPTKSELTAVHCRSPPPRRRHRSSAPAAASQSCLQRLPPRQRPRCCPSPSRCRPPGVAPLLAQRRPPPPAQRTPRHRATGCYAVTARPSRSWPPGDVIRAKRAQTASFLYFTGAYASPSSTLAVELHTGSLDIQHPR
jgi:hypothetical protein